MRHEELIHLLALQNIDGIGDIVAKKLISHCGSAEDVFKSKASKLSRIDGVGSTLLRKLKDTSAFRKAEAEALFILTNNIDFCDFREDHYPARLKHCPDGPILLFTSGNINTQKKKIISIVGTRQITGYGMEVCRKLISDLAPLDPVIVSGFAYGVDICAHLAAIENNLQTIGILAHGLNQTYPKIHRKYISKMEANGGFITEFESTSDPERENFLRRNRIVAGMSEALIVIESADKGGSLVTASMANDYNRDVFAVPGRISDKYSQGCNNLIKTQRAHTLTSAADLIYIMGWDIDTAKKPVQKQLFISLDDDQQKVYDFLMRNGKEMLDNIALECGFPIFRISGLLLDMELKGVIRPLPGKLFEAV